MSTRQKEWHALKIELTSGTVDYRRFLFRVVHMHNAKRYANGERTCPFRIQEHCNLINLDLPAFRGQASVELAGTKNWKRQT